MLLAHGNLFAPVDLKRRIFRKVPRGDPRDGLLDRAGPATGGDRAGPRWTRLRDEAARGQPRGPVVVDRGRPAGAGQPAGRALFGLPRDDVGRPFQDLELSYRPLELRSRSSRRSRATRRSGSTTSSGRPAPARSSAWRSRSCPLVDDDGELARRDRDASPTSPATAGSRTSSSSANRELETAYEELQSTNEELETTNEELQSTVEELETTNEELQSTNEELETMNEELQSTNDELQTINDELRRPHRAS